MTFEWMEVDGRRVPATDGPPVGDERVVDGMRLWEPHESKIAACLALGLDLPFDSDDAVLYLGGGGGTTPSYVADVARVVYAVEFASRPARRLLDVAADRPGLMPVVEDARRPERYRAFVEEVDFLYQDVATRGQADVALRNRDYLRDGGVAWLCVKARSEDVTREPGEVYDDVVGELEGSFDVERVVDLEPFYDDHAVVVASKL